MGLLYRLLSMRTAKRESGTEHLQQAVEPYSAALEMLAVERPPLRHEHAQRNLGRALQMLRDRGI